MVTPLEAKHLSGTTALRPGGRSLAALGVGAHGLSRPERKGGERLVRPKDLVGPEYGAAPRPSVLRRIQAEEWGRVGDGGIGARCVGYAEGQERGGPVQPAVDLRRVF